jgi:hypothetical protein
VERRVSYPEERTPANLEKQTNTETDMTNSTRNRKHGNISSSPLIYIADGGTLGGAAIQGDSAARSSELPLSLRKSSAQSNPPLPMSHLLVIEHPNSKSAYSELEIKQMDIVKTFKGKRGALAMRW